MTAQIINLHGGPVAGELPSGELVLVLSLQPRAAKRLRSRARDARMEPDDLAAQLLEKILFPEASNR